MHGAWERTLWKPVHVKSVVFVQTSHGMLHPTCPPSHWACTVQINSVIKELAGTRKRMLLVQAISQHRQKRPTEVTNSLLNLLSCCRVMPETTAMQWTEQSELRELFGSFCSKVCGFDAVM